FQDILSSKTIGCGTRKCKLYYLDLASDCEASLNQTYKIGGASVEKHTSEVCNRSPVGSDRSPVTLPESNWSPPESDWSLLGHQTQLVVSSPYCPTQEEEIDEILPAPDTSSDLVPH
ncbi:unnamed protein product, partial [Prunus brigantina]